MKTARYSLGELELGLRGALDDARRHDRAQRRRDAVARRVVRAAGARRSCSRTAPRVDKLPEPHAAVGRVILARAARSARRTTHFDLDFPSAPTTEPYHCFKHKRTCRPTEEAAKFLTRYTTDTIRRIREFAPVRTDAHGDRPPRRRAHRRACRRSPTASSPRRPIPGLIDYHEQHRYAYELLGLVDRRDEEIGAAAAGRARAAVESYVEAMSAVFENTRAPAGRGRPGADRRQRLEGPLPAHPRRRRAALEERITRHVNRRTGRRAGEYFEDVLICRPL